MTACCWLIGCWTGGLATAWLQTAEMLLSAGCSCAAVGWPAYWLARRVTRQPVCRGLVARTPLIAWISGHQRDQSDPATRDSSASGQQRDARSAAMRSDRYAVCWLGSSEAVLPSNDSRQVRVAGCKLPRSTAHRVVAGKARPRSCSLSVMPPFTGIFRTNGYLCFLFVFRCLSESLACAVSAARSTFITDLVCSDQS